MVEGGEKKTQLKTNGEIAYLDIFHTPLFDQEYKKLYENKWINNRNLHHSVNYYSLLTQSLLILVKITD